MFRDVLLMVIVAHGAWVIYCELTGQRERMLGIFRHQGYRYDTECPHSSFVRKHLCSNCSSESDALKVSIRRTEFSPTAINGVIFGERDHNLWEIVNDFHGHKTMCKNKQGMMHFTCNLSANRCQKNGKSCFTLHDAENGHFFYKKTICNY